MPRITSVDGLFGQKLHYDEMGNLIGESWPGLLEGSWEHYDQNGYAGYSDPGLFADQVHHDAGGRYAGETWDGFQGQKIHYGPNGYAGITWDGLTGSHTDLDTDLFAPLPDDPF